MLTAAKEQLRTSLDADTAQERRIDSRSTFMEASMSTVPTSRSSVTPKGICTKGASMTFLGTWPPSPVTLSLRPTFTHKTKHYNSYKSLLSTRVMQLWGTLLEMTPAAIPQHPDGNSFGDSVYLLREGMRCEACKARHRQLGLCFLLSLECKPEMPCDSAVTGQVRTLTA